MIFGTRLKFEEKLDWLDKETKIFMESRVHSLTMLKYILIPFFYMHTHTTCTCHYFPVHGCRLIT